MNIGFDAKRAFHNVTGLGNYSRTMIDSLSSFFPGNTYYLFNPKKSSLYSFHSKQLIEINPSGIVSKLLPSLWRTRWMIGDIEKRVDIYHGLSNELPFGIHRSKIKKVVTIHDLIFEHYPDQYKKNDVIVYRKKFKYACKHADIIIAISESTKKDLVDLYAVPPEKIEVCYQSCDQRFFTRANPNQKENVLDHYGLQTPYFLSVGSIIERKNLLRICMAFKQLQQEIPCNLVVIGKGNGLYKEDVLNYITKEQLAGKIIFLEDNFRSDAIQKDMPVLYQQATALVYPSLMEGFGIPVLEAMASGIPVITSNRSSLTEAGGDAAQCIDPLDTTAMADAMKRILFDHNFREQCIQKGLQHAQTFNNQLTAQKVLSIYKKLNAIL
jgi:glycosyltransferase involved in cell wall biosynthesis